MVRALHHGEDLRNLVLHVVEMQMVLGLQQEVHLLLSGCPLSNI